MKRKSLLILALCASLIFGLAACGGSGGSGGGSRGENGSITVFNYGDYIDRDLIAQFENEYGITVNYEEYVAPEDMYTKYTSGAIDYDVIITSDYMVEKLMSEDQLLPIDTSGMEHIGNIGDRYWEFCRAFDPENSYAVPYLWGTVGIIYNTTMVDDDVNSWNIMWDEDYANSIIMENSVRDAFIAPLRLRGDSINTTDEAELRAACDMLVDQYPLVYAYQVDETRDSMISGEAALGMIYSGDATVAIEANPDLAYTIPSEGSNVWIDCAVIPASATNVEGAQQFIDFLCSYDAAMANFEYIYYGTPNEAILDDLDEDVLADTTIFPTDEMLENCEVFRYLGSEADALYTDLWQIVKTSN